MKIFEYIPQLNSGGGERFTIDLCNELSKRHNVTLCISHPIDSYGFYKEEISPRIKIICLNKKKGLDWRLPFRLYNFLRKEQPDIVHTHLSAIVYIVLSALLLSKTRFFHTIHSAADKESGNRIETKIRRFLFTKKLVTPITISPDSLKSFRDFYNMNAPLINNGRDIPKNIEISAKVKEEFKTYRKTSQTRVIIQLAHIGPWKRQDIMAKVSHRLMQEGYDFTVLMIGRTHDINIENSIKSLRNPNIHLLGSKQNPLEYLKASDAFALTSLFEGLPISLIEAIGTGLIPICTPVGGIVNIIKDSVNGFLSKDTSEEAYYIALKRYLDTPNDILQRIKNAALESYAPFTMVECAKNYELLFE